MTEDRTCAQCGKPVVAGHMELKGTVIDEEGAMHLEKEIRHYDCLQYNLREADEFIAAAVAAAESGIKDEALRDHLMGDSSGS